MKNPKILYAIQGTGNGHISRAIEILPHLKKKAEVDILLSGIQSDIELPFEIKYRFYGMSFIFGKKGGIDYYETWKKTKFKNLLQEIDQLPTEHYDLIISDFEPVSSWAGRKKGQTVIGLSNQAAVMADGSPQPRKKDLIGKLVLQKYAPSDYNYGFHFQRYNPLIYTPIIRREVREMDTKNHNHYTVYLPAFEDKKILKRLSKFPDIQWHVFSKHTKYAYEERNIHVQPIRKNAFMESLSTSEGIITGAGFATPSEALYLGKKLMVIPMKKQYEQQCNAEALKRMGIPVIKSLKKKHLPKIEDWLQNGKVINVHYPDETENLLQMILDRHL